MACEKIA